MRMCMRMCMCTQEDRGGVSIFVDFSLILDERRATFRCAG